MANESKWSTLQVSIASFALVLCVSAICVAIVSVKQIDSKRQMQSDRLEAERSEKQTELDTERRMHEDDLKAKKRKFWEREVKSGDHKIEDHEGEEGFSPDPKEKF